MFFVKLKLQLILFFKDDVFYFKDRVSERERERASKGEAERSSICKFSQEPGASSKSPNWV